MLRWLIVGLVLSVWLGNGRADVILANSLGGTVGGYDDVRDNPPGPNNTRRILAQQLSNTNVFTGPNLGFYVAGTFRNTTNSAFNVTLSLWSNTGTSPNQTPNTLLGSVVVSLGANAGSNLVSTIGGNITVGSSISANQVLWLSASGGARDGDLQWQRVTTTGSPGFTDWARGSSETSPTWTALTQPIGGSGSYAALVSVPEPGTLALGAFAALGGVGGWWMRKKRGRGDNTATAALEMGVNP